MSLVVAELDHGQDRGAAIHPMEILLIQGWYQHAGMGDSLLILGDHLLDGSGSRFRHSIMKIEHFHDDIACTGSHRCGWLAYPMDQDANTKAEPRKNRDSALEKTMARIKDLQQWQWYW
jgi:hypothetical protein